VLAQAVDAADRAAVQGLVDAAVAGLGGIDVLVNTAGVYHAASMLDTAPEDFDRVMQVNLYGAFHVMQLSLRQMGTQGSGKVTLRGASAFEADGNQVLYLVKDADRR
jgi:glucose 1-dehydrogenase